MQQRYDFSQHTNRPNYRGALENLADEHRATAGLQAEQQRLLRRYGD